LLYPLILNIVQVDIRQEWRYHAIDAKDNFEFERQVALCRIRSVLDLRRKK
jgi:hypothetical protein